MSSIKQTVKQLCPDSVLSVYGGAVHTIRRAPQTAKHAYRWLKDVKPRLEEDALRRKLFGSDAGMVAPMRLIRDGSRSLFDFKNVGEDCKELFIKYGRLEPNSAIMDLGCGVGRCAIPLTHYLNNSGEYLGIDIDAPAIEWCKQKISTQHSNFSFSHLDAYSNNYNPQGKMQAADMQLPCASGNFDLIVAMSLFTHMFMDGVRNYLSECYRALKPGGRLLMTCFILNDESRNLISSGQGLQLIHANGESFVLLPEEPETAVGHPEAVLFAACDAVGFRRREVFSGNWCGRNEYVSYQDVIVCYRD